MTELSQYRGKRTRNKHKYLRKRRRRVFLWVAVVLLLLAAAGVGVFALYGFDVNNLPFFRGEDPQLALKQPKERVNTLIIYVKETDAAEEADEFALATYSPKTKKLDFISIPKNTMTEIPGQGVGDLKQAYSLGKIALTKSSVEYLTGIKINHYIKIDADGVEKVVDKMGGVTLEGKLTNGRETVKFLEPKTKDEKELARVERLNSFLVALQKAANGEKVFNGMKGVLGAVKGAYDADFSESDSLDLALVAAVLKPEQVKAQALPVKEVVVNQKVFYQPEKTALDTMIARIFPEAMKSSQKLDIKVRVLNGVGEPGLASTLAKTLTDAGYRVVDTKNADTFGYEETQIIIYDGKKSAADAAGKVKILMGMGKIISNNLPQDVADITIIIGRDYADKVRKYELQKKVEVLNGTSRAGFAATIGEKLTAGGLNVVNTGNADRSDYATTIITVYVDNDQVSQMAADIKSLLGAGDVAVSKTHRTDIEISITLGKDLQ